MLKQAGMNEVFQPTQACLVRKNAMSELLTIHFPSGSNHIGPKLAANCVDNHPIRKNNRSDNDIGVDQAKAVLGKQLRRSRFSTAHSACQTQDHRRRGYCNQAS
jgi:hypothetical protein